MRNVARQCGCYLGSGAIGCHYALAPPLADGPFLCFRSLDPAFAEGPSGLQVAMVLPYCHDFPSLSLDKGKDHDQAK